MAPLGRKLVPAYYAVLTNTGKGNAVNRNAPQNVFKKLADFVHEREEPGVRVIVGLKSGEVISGEIDYLQTTEQFHLHGVSNVPQVPGRTIAYRFPRTALAADRGREFVGVDMTLERFRLTDYATVIGREVSPERWLHAVKREQGGSLPDHLPAGAIDDGAEDYIYLLDSYFSYVHKQYDGGDKLDVDWGDVNCCGDRA